MFHGEPRCAPRARCPSPAVPLLPLTPRLRDGGRHLPALIMIGMQLATSLRLPLGWSHDGALSCHPYARRGGERDGRAPHHHGVRMPATAGVMDWWRPPRGQVTAGTPCLYRINCHRGNANTSPQSTPRRPAPPPGRPKPNPGRRPPGAPTHTGRSATATTGRGRWGRTSALAVGMTPSGPERCEAPMHSSARCSTPPDPSRLPPARGAAAAGRRCTTGPHSRTGLWRVPPA